MPDGLVGDVRSELGLTRRVFARLTGYSERAIAAWESGRAPGDASLQRMREMHRLCDALARVMKRAEISRWLNEPNRALGRLKPLEAVERGEIDRVWRLIFYLESGVAS